MVLEIYAISLHHFTCKSLLPPDGIQTLDEYDIMVSSAYLCTFDWQFSFFHQNQQYLRQTVHSLSPMTSFPLTWELTQRYKSGNDYEVKLQPAALHGSMADFCKPKHVAPESIIERTRHAHPQQPGLQTTFHLTFLPVMFGTSSIPKTTPNTSPTQQHNDCAKANAVDSEKWPCS